MSYGLCPEQRNGQSGELRQRFGRFTDICNKGDELGFKPLVSAVACLSTILPGRGAVWMEADTEHCPFV